MSWSELQKFSKSESEKIKRGELAKNVSVLVSAANKRFRRLEKEGATDSFAYMRYYEKKGNFSVKGKDINELRTEFVRVKAFLQDQTSTVKGFKTLISDVEKRLNAEGIYTNLGTAEQRRGFWEAYERAMERHPESRQDSLRVQKMIREIYDAGQEDEDDEKTLDEKIEEILKDVYKENEKNYVAAEREASGRAENGFYNIWEGVEDKRRSR